MDNKEKIIYSVWILGILAIMLLPLVLAVETRYEWYIVNDDDYWTIDHTDDYRGQTFTVGTVGVDEDFDVTNVTFLLYKVGSPGNIYTVIRAVDVNEKPIGPILSSGTFDGDTLTTNAAGEWKNISMSSYTLQASTQYYVGMDGNDTSVGNSVHLRNDYANGAYGGGDGTYSNDGGSTWIIQTDTDLMFEVWGEAVPVDTCTCAGAGNDWEIDMSDYCNITDACDLTTGTLSFTGAGWCNCNASVDTTNLGDPGASGVLYIQDSCLITID